MIVRCCVVSKTGPYYSQPSSFPYVGTSQATDNFPSIYPLGFQLATALNGITCSSNITMSVEGVAPNRQVVLRYNVCPYVLSAVLNPTTAIFDVVMSEGTGGLEIRYYQMPNIPAGNVQYITIGIHGDADVYTQYTAFSQFNYAPFSAGLSQILAGSTLTYTYTGVSQLAGCSALGANFTSLSQSDLVYVDPIKNNTYYIRPCSHVSAPVCANQANTALASVCLVSPTGNSTMISQYNPSAVFWNSSPAGAGVRMTLSDGAYCSGQPRTSVIDYLCVKGNTSTALLSVVEAPACTTTITIQTPLACTSTPACFATVTGDQYSYTACPTVPAPLVQTNPVYIYDGGRATSDDSVNRTALPIVFHVYGVAFDYVWVGSNGNLQFGPAGSTSAFLTLPVSASSDDTLPLIAPFMADLGCAGLEWNSNYVKQSVKHTHEVPRCCWSSVS